MNIVSGNTDADGQDQPAGQRRDLRLRRHDQVHDHGHRPRGRHDRLLEGPRSNTALGHNDHSHGDQSMTGCSRPVHDPGRPGRTRPSTSGTSLGASYTDKTTGLELTGTNQVDPRVEHAAGRACSTSNTGFTPNRAAAAAGGNGRMGYTDPGDYLRFDKMNMVGIDSVTVPHQRPWRRPHRDARGLADRPAGRDRPGRRLRRLGDLQDPGARPRSPIRAARVTSTSSRPRPASTSTSSRSTARAPTATPTPVPRPRTPRRCPARRR